MNQKVSLFNFWVILEDKKIKSHSPLQFCQII
jgi:hypothetical protein